MKVGILTFHCAANYGAVLQAYALQETIKSLGHETFILDYKPRYITDSYTPFQPYWNYNPKNLPRCLLKAFIRYRRQTSFNSFTKKYLNIIPLEYAKEMDIMIAGSDQIWAPEITGKQFDKTYFLDMGLTHPHKRIIYAASAGGGKLFKEKLNADIIRIIDNLDAVSVRENILQDIISDSTTKVKPELVLDPVLLGGKEVFGKLIDKRLVPEKPYILVFGLQHSPDLINIALNISNGETQIIEMISGDEAPAHPNIVQTATPQKFISLIKYSKGVITNSFHGTALSLLFNTPFISVAYSKGHGERVHTLLHALDIEDRQIIGFTHDRKELILQSDFDVCNKRLISLREKSKQFLIKNLST